MSVYPKWQSRHILKNDGMEDYWMQTITEPSYQIIDQCNTGLRFFLETIDTRLVVIDTMECILSFNWLPNMVWDAESKIE